MKISVEKFNANRESSQPANTTHDAETRRLNAKEIITPKESEHFIFPIADGTAKLSGRDYGVRESIRR